MVGLSYKILPLENVQVLTSRLLKRAIANYSVLKLNFTSVKCLINVIFYAPNEG